MLYLGSIKTLIMRPTTFLSVCILFFSCSTPAELLEKGKIERAFKLAEKKIKAGKDLNTNTKVLVFSGDQIIQSTLFNNSPLMHSPNVEDWVRAQNNFFKTLEDIVVANDLVDGQLQNSYDQLCTQKIELDFKIADHFYQNGTDLLAFHYEHTSKHHARKAYYQYQECLSFGGDRFFQNLEDKISESVEEGKVYFVSHNFRPSSNLFFQPLPPNADFEADCIIQASFGPINYSTHSHSSTTTHSKDIEVGKNSKVDTSGQIVYTPIMKTVYADVITTSVTVTASSYSDIYVDNITGQCSKRSKSFNACVSDSYEEVRIHGDRRALNTSISACSGQPAFFISNLESDLNFKIDCELGYW